VINYPSDYFIYPKSPQSVARKVARIRLCHRV